MSSCMTAPTASKPWPKVVVRDGAKGLAFATEPKAVARRDGANDLEALAGGCCSRRNRKLFFAILPIDVACDCANSCCS